MTERHKCDDLDPTRTLCGLAVERADIGSPITCWRCVNAALDRAEERAEQLEAALAGLPDYGAAAYDC